MDETFLPGLTPAQKSGDEGLLSLERAVIESSDDLKRQSHQQIANMNASIRESLNMPGNADSTKDAFENAQNYLNDLLDTRIKVAAQKADERIESMTPTLGREGANRIAAEEVDSALAAARKQESDLYEMIPMDSEVPTTSAATALKNATDEIGAAQSSDIPQIARRFLDPESDSYLGDISNIKELRSLQIKLREIGRIARANKSFNKARIADNIANAITDDISNTLAGPEVSKAVQTAVGVSRSIAEGQSANCLVYPGRVQRKSLLVFL